MMHVILFFLVMHHAMYMTSTVGRPLCCPMYPSGLQKFSEYHLEGVLKAPHKLSDDQMIQHFAERGIHYAQVTIQNTRTAFALLNHPSMIIRCYERRRYTGKPLTRDFSQRCDSESEGTNITVMTDLHEPLTVDQLFDNYVYYSEIEKSITSQQCNSAASNFAVFFGMVIALAFLVIAVVAVCVVCSRVLTTGKSLQGKRK